MTELGQGEGGTTSSAMTAGAAIAAVLAGLVWWFGPSPSAAGEPLACPTDYRGTVDRAWVPSVGPVSGVDARGSLVPTARPEAAIVCWYAGGRNVEPLPPPVPVTGGLRLDDRDLEPVAGLLSKLPRSPRGVGCTDMGGQVTHQLIGLEYPTGTVWVSAPDEPNGCVDAGNGVRSAPGWLGEVVHRSVVTGRWCTTSAERRRALDDCEAPRPDAVKQVDLVPAHVDRVLVTALVDDGDFGGGWAAERGPLVLDPHERDTLLATMRSLDYRSAPGSWQCQASSAVSYRVDLVGRDRSVTSVEVRDDDCPAAVISHSRSADDPGGRLYSTVGDLVAEIPRVP